MKILYEVGDVIHHKLGDKVVESVVHDVVLLEGADNVITIEYQVEYNGAELAITEESLQSPLHPDSVDFFKQVDSVEQPSINVTSWAEGLEPRPDNSQLPCVVTLLMAIQYDKEGTYGSSWKGKGEYRGIMANIDRKYDRLDVITQKEIAGEMNTLARQNELLASNYELYSEQVGESKIDAIADLANYCLLYMTYVRENYPEVFRLWVDKNLPKYLADRISFIQTEH